MAIMAQTLEAPPRACMVPAPPAAIVEAVLELTRSAVAGVITARAVTCPSLTCPTCSAVTCPACPPITLTCPPAVGMELGLLAILLAVVVALIAGVVIGFALGAACCQERRVASRPQRGVSAAQSGNR